MKKILGLVCLLVALPLAARASHNTDLVEAAEQARSAALLRGDAKALAAVLSDDLHYVHATGKIEAKHDTVDALASKRSAYERLVSYDHHFAEIADNIVVLNGKMDQRKLSSGKWADQILLFQAVWRNESGTWRLVALQTVIPPVVPAPAKS